MTPIKKSRVKEGNSRVRTGTTNTHNKERKKHTQEKQTERRNDAGVRSF